MAYQASRVPSYEQQLAANQEAERKYMADMSWWERAVNGAKTGYNEGSEFGMWGAIGGAAGGAIDGAVDGGVYKAHVKNGDTVAQGGGQGFGGSGGGGGMMGGGGGGARGSMAGDRSAFGYVPYAAEYREVPLNAQDYQGIQRDTVQGNLDMANLIAQLLVSNGRTNQQISQSRANGFDPNLWGNVGKTANVASGYLDGQASWSDSMEAVARSTSLTGSVGTPGTGAALTARDLGIMDMDLRQRGAQMNAQAIQQSEALDPRANYGRPQDYGLTPSQAVPWKMDENLKLSSLAIQQSENRYAADQNANNLAASPDPMAKGLYEGNLALSLAKTRNPATSGGGMMGGMMGGGGGSSGGMDWSSIIKSFSGGGGK